MQINIAKRKADSYKGDYGHVFVIAGSIGMTGAAVLCSKSALISGAGIVTLGIPESLSDICEVKLTEEMTLSLPQTQAKTLSLTAYQKIIDFAKDVDVLVIGPGLSKEKHTQALVKKLIIASDKPIILDADGLYAIREDLEVLKQRKASTILTPHIGELAYLTGQDKKDIKNNREDLTKQLSSEYNICLVLKGHQTIVADTGKIYINKTGNPGMATAGSGDVLAGLIAALLGQGMNSFEAAKAGVYLHGLAGDFAAEKKGEVSIIASDILNYLPEAIKTIYNSS